MARAIDCGELEKRISSLARLARSDAQKSLLGRVLYIVENMPTLTPPNEWVSVEDAVPDPGERVLATDGIFVEEAYRSSANRWFRHIGFPWRDGVTGRTVRFWMPLPAPPGKDNNVSTNEPLTIEELREMDGEPVYVHNLFPAKRKFEWQWALVCKERGNAEATTYTYRFLDYGKTWIAYRRPPEGEA